MKRIQIKKIILKPIHNAKIDRKVSLELIGITLKNEGIKRKHGRYMYNKVPYIR